MRLEIKSVKASKLKKLFVDMEHEIDEMAKKNYELISHSHSYSKDDGALDNEDCYTAIMIFVHKDE